MICNIKDVRILRVCSEEIEHNDCNKCLIDHEILYKNKKILNSSKHKVYTVAVNTIAL